MGDPWEIGGLGGVEEKPNIKQIAKKKSVKKSEKAAKSGRNRKNRIFFTENGLNCIRNPTKHL